jgi:O-antigen ligase
VAVAQFVTQYRSVRALHPDRIYAYMTSDRVGGFMGHWMTFGGQQMLVFAALVSFLLLARGMAAGLEDSGKGAALKEGAPRRGARKIWWAILAVVAISIVLNFSRGVWLGCTVALVYLVSRWKPRWLLALPLVLFLGYLAAPSLVRQRIRVLRHPTAEPSLSIRFEMWRVALRMIEAHPLVGVGPNSIDQVYVLYLATGKPPEPGYHQHFHNNFLQFGAERGLPCLAAWVWLMAALAWHSVRVRRWLVREGRPTWTTDAALAAWLALVVEGCFEFNFGTSPVLMLFLFVTSTPFVVDKQARVDG